MKRMLINAAQQEELRVALVDGQRLYDVDIESTSREQKKSNIYKARVVRIEPSLEAAFVDFGAERHGFLPFKEIARSLFKNEGGRGRFNVKDHLQVGQELIIQVEKPERGNKGAALTTFVSLAGRYLVLMPNNPRAGGVSRQIEGDDRSEAREAMSAVTIPAGMGMILRTAGVGKSSEELQWDLDYLLRVWDAIIKAANEHPAPFLIYRESEVIIRAIRDYLRQDINEILIDNQEVYNRAHEFMSQVMPHNLGKLKLYTERDPLFIRYQVESQIESAFAREVTLPSGGSVIIDHTEALVSIDINSARATAGGDIEETALNTNLEAAEEISRQLRLRDIGGLIVIDFIDMMNAKNQREVENKLRECVRDDRARVQINRISRFGLLELSRQRLRPSLGESSHIVCPRCSGTGHLRSVESLSLSVYRILEEEAMKENTAKVVAHLPVDVATFLLNEKRQNLRDIEDRLNIEVILIPKPELETPRYKIHRIRLNDEQLPAIEKQTSYRMDIEEEEEQTRGFDLGTRQNIDQPAVKQVIPTQPVPASSSQSPSENDQPGTEHVEPAPAQENAKAKGLISRLFGSLFGVPEETTSEDGVSQSRQTSAGSRSRPAHGSDAETGPGQRSSSSTSQSGSGSRRGKRRESGEGEEGYSTEGRKQRSSSRRGRRGGRRRRRSDSSGSGGGTTDDSKQQETASPENTSEQKGDSGDNATKDTAAKNSNQNNRRGNPSSATDKSGNRRGNTEHQREQHGTTTAETTTPANENNPGNKEDRTPAASADVSVKQESSNGSKQQDDIQDTGGMPVNESADTPQASETSGSEKGEHGVAPDDGTDAAKNEQQDNRNETSRQPEDGQKEQPRKPLYGTAAVKAKAEYDDSEDLATVKPEDNKSTETNEP
ncbi:MAG: Rne/Rng family ribonuclease [Gammaproteobacteria bacterium]|nr:Rne/Rng family ribonuclease [Gammaproteobacteria bacterium]